MSADDEKDPPVPADVEGKFPKKVHDKTGADDDEAQADKPHD